MALGKHPSAGGECLASLFGMSYSLTSFLMIIPFDAPMVKK